MTKQCCAGGVLTCSFGACPAVLNVLPINMVSTTTPAANILDNKPLMNVTTFGLCSSPVNPLVIANLGFPVPCVPNIISPWLIGVPNILIGNLPALNDQSKCMCLYTGLISVSFSGQVFVDVG